MTFGEIWWQILLLAVGSYLFGNINWALLISKLKKSDVRKMGSGNPGTLNMSRNFGLKIGVLTLFLDVLKGAVPTLVGMLIFRGKYLADTGFALSDMIKYICGVCVILGHIYPVLMKFKGGKGIASTIGVFAASRPLIALIFIIVAVTYVYFTEYGSMGSLVVVTPLAIIELICLHLKYIGTNAPLYALAITNMLILSTTILTWFAHRKNLVRLVNGTEHPTSIKSMLKKKRAKKGEGKA